VERYCGKQLVKGKERTGNWEAELDQKQINCASLDYILHLYISSHPLSITETLKLRMRNTTDAANDAHSGLMVYKKLIEMAKENKVTLVPEEYTSHVKPGVLGMASGSDSESASDAGNSVFIAPSNTPDAVTKKVILTWTMQMAGMKPQQLRAYRYWHVDGMAVETMCRELSLKCDGEPLKVGTVMSVFFFCSASRPLVISGTDVRADADEEFTFRSYVIGALQADPTLPFEMKRLRKLVQMESGSWERHRAWILKVGNEEKGRS
jgi:hypothetical protein